MGPSVRRRRRIALALAAALAAVACIVLLPCGSRSNDSRGAAQTEAFSLRRRHREAVKGGADSRGAAAGKSQVATSTLLDVALVELQVDTGPWRVAKVLFPMSPEVAKWWTAAEGTEFSARLDRSLTGQPRIHVQISGGAPLQVNGTAAQGLHAVVDLPETAVLEECHVGSVRVTAEFDPLRELGPIRALLVVCPVRSDLDGRGALSAQGVLGNTILAGRHPLRWLLLPWMLLLLPFVVGSSIGPLALLGGACLTLASIACLSFIIAILIVIVQRKCMLFTRRWRRLWRLRALRRRPWLVSAAFGEHGPCCICLGDADSRDQLIALLPCRHALHDECYNSWVRADAYPSPDLICPLCRCRADAIGKLAPEPAYAPHHGGPAV